MLLLPQFLSDFNYVWFVCKSLHLCIKLPHGFEKMLLLCSLGPNQDLIGALYPPFTRNASYPIPILFDLFERACACAINFSRISEILIIN